MQLFLCLSKSSACNPPSLASLVMSCIQQMSDMASVASTDRDEINSVQMPFLRSQASTSMDVLPEIRFRLLKIVVQLTLVRQLVACDFVNANY